MVDDEAAVRAYSKDRRVYRHDSTAIEIRKTSENYTSNRNGPEMISVFALQNRMLEHREKRIYQSTTHDEHYYNTVNYPLQSRTATPVAYLKSQNVPPEGKEIKLPKVATRITSNTVKQFPTTTSRSTSIVSHKNSIPNSVKPSSSSVKMPSVSKERKSKSQVSSLLHRPDWQYFY